MSLHRGRVANISVNEFSFRINVLRSSVPVDLRHEQIEHAHAVAALYQRIG